MGRAEAQRSRGRSTGVLLEAPHVSTKEDAVASRKTDEWTIEKWRTDARWGRLEFGDTLLDRGRPLWRDLTVASVVAVVLWVAAAVVFR